MLVEAWAKGWAIARGTPAPVQVPEGWRIDVSLPGHVTRFVLPTPAPDLAGRLTAPDTWLKICADPATVQLDERWQVQPTEYLMSTQLATELTAEPAATGGPGYELRLTRTGSVIDVLVSNRGEPAARGKAAVHNDYAVIDQVVTEPGHQRRGLGTTVMRALSQAAHRSGASTGVLVATADGLALYSRLGWTLVSAVTAARLCAPECPASRGDLPRG